METSARAVTCQARLFRNLRIFLRELVPEGDLSPGDCVTLSSQSVASVV